MDDKAKILIIDDEEVVLDSCIQIFKSGDYDIDTAQNGQLGIKLVEELEPDLVYVDLKMPGISGFEVLEKINQIDPTIVSIVITGYATVSSAVEAMKKGADDFLPKPFTPDELRLITQRGLEKRRLILETISLRKEKEMLRDHFAAIVSHELKSPLGAVQQNLFLLEDELSSELTEDQKNRFEHIESRLNDLMKLIHTWLRVISAEDIEKIRDAFKPTAIPDMVSKAIESVQPHAMRKDIELVTSVDSNLKPINGDEGTLVEAVVNIIGNAIKFSRVGSRVIIKAEQQDDFISISITDSGVGISKEELPVIFNDFYRGKSGQAVGEGSGLGLALTRRIIEAHNGSISVESELSKGSTFTIFLPTVKENAQIAEAMVSSA
ncbi:MAG TPA: HAMP domain-containing sensor histidine kinase [Anaerolineales bacterium]|jgi:signal transduction histidine kinase|nr:HAMP domain-containing sensor histidine kinase [Anaerolineales bacterium]